MNDFICLEKIKSLIDHIVTKQLSKRVTVSMSDEATTTNTLHMEDIETFKQIRKAHEESIKSEQAVLGSYQGNTDSLNRSHDSGLLMNGRGLLSKKAIEDQVSI